MIATKEQEREALKKIRKIVEGLGEESYLRFAFEGCFEKAEENIENDMACSYKQVADSLEYKVEELEKDLKETKMFKQQLINENGELHKEVVDLNNKVVQMKKAMLRLITCATLYMNDLGDKSREQVKAFNDEKDLTKESLDEFYKKQSTTLEHLNYTKETLTKAQEIYKEVYNEANC